MWCGEQSWTLRQAQSQLTRKIGLTAHPWCLRFTSMGLRRNMTSEGEEVSTSMTWAYGETLKPYHGWAVRPIFLVSWGGECKVDPIRAYLKSQVIAPVTASGPLYPLAFSSSNSPSSVSSRVSRRARTFVILE
jgi:hypothetical protein